MGRAAIVAFLLIVSSVSASADIVWVCQFPDYTPRGWPHPRYWVHDKTLSEIVEPFSEYKVLVDNDLATIGVASGATDAKAEELAGSPRGKLSSIDVMAIAIDKKTGDAVLGSVTVHGKDAASVHGECHQQRKGDPDAIWPRQMDESAPVSSARPN
jgi:hypothetical protein